MLKTERRKKYAEAVSLYQPGSSEEKIYRELGNTTDPEFADTPLSDVVDYIKNKHEIEIQLDSKGLTDAAVDPSAARDPQREGDQPAQRPAFDSRGIRPDLRRAGRGVEDHIEGKGGRDSHHPRLSRGRPRDPGHDPHGRHGRVWAAAWGAWVAAWAAA